MARCLFHVPLGSGATKHRNLTGRSANAMRCCSVIALRLLHGSVQLVMFLPWARCHTMTREVLVLFLILVLGLALVLVLILVLALVLVLV